MGAARGGHSCDVSPVLHQSIEAPNAEVLAITHRAEVYADERVPSMRWIASIIWALLASLTTNGLIAFVMGGLDHAWVILGVSLIWLTFFLRACPLVYDTSERPTSAG
jgi:hypothetical protein